VTAAEIVLDASVAVRGLVGEPGMASEVADAVAGGVIAASAPELIVPEVTNALRMRVDPDRWPLGEAQRALDAFLSWPVTILPCAPLATGALAIATERSISAYDAFYAVISEALEAPLYTADRRLAAAVTGSVLVQ
jgi:predicted nucleic acid-binding protein